MLFIFKHNLKKNNILNHLKTEYIESKIWVGSGHVWCNATRSSFIYEKNFDYVITTGNHYLPTRRSIIIVLGFISFDWYLH